MNVWKLYAFADEAGSMMEDQIAAMKRNHLDGLEIRTVDGESIAAITLAKAAEVRKKMDDAGLTTWSIGSPIGKIGIDDPFAPHLDRLRHVLDVAHVLGAQRIRMFSFYIPHEKQPSAYRNAVMDRMGAMLEAARGSGIALCHENEKGIYGDVATRCRDLHETFPELRGIFDPANYIQSGQETWEAWQMLAEYIDYLHIKDALADGSVVPAGKGIGHVKEIVQQFHACGGRCMTIEPHLKIFDGLKLLEREGERTQMDCYVYETNDQAFDAACEALRALI